MNELSDRASRLPAFYLTCRLGPNYDQSEMGRECPNCPYRKDCEDFLMPIAKEIKRLRVLGVKNLVKELHLDRG